MFDHHYELSVLCRAIHYNNLSSASLHVGLSQPQLSRIIARLESTLNIILLDRSSRRKAHFTPIAFRLVETYLHSSHKLEKELDHWIRKNEPTTLKGGTLEGLIPLALQFCNTLLKKSTLKTLQLDVFDLNLLEEFFLNGDLMLLFTSRAPGRRKYKYERQLGYQILETKGKAGRSPASTPRVLSAFEYGKEKHALHLKPLEKTFISNSLEVRRNWIDQMGGNGIIPSEVLQHKPKFDFQNVLLIADDSLSHALWDILNSSSSTGKVSA
jgi:LysR family transcriptional regulator, transcriptional activator for aaeXAB operon